jgi:glycerol-3-phosphate dehydrogenase (NAD(P)+)
LSFTSVGVIGAGSWGTALALLLHGNGLPVTIWGNNAPHIAEMRETQENKAYLPGVALPATLGLTDNLEDLCGCDLLLLVTPSKAVREVASRLFAAQPRKDAVLLSCTKGVERGSGLRMSEILAEYFPENPVAVLSGPSHAEEVARKRPTCVVIGARDSQIAHRLQKVFSTPYFRAYTNDDVPGIELGGALKNIYALAAGVCDGLALGDNAKAALVTRALVELGRIGSAMGGRRETFMGLGGVGDLMVTCFSQHSRNRAVGERLGKGERLADIVSSMQMVAEGVAATYSAHDCVRKLGVEAPIIEQVKAILDGAVAPAEALTQLLGRDPKSE